VNKPSAPDCPTRLLGVPASWASCRRAGSLESQPALARTADHEAMIDPTLALLGLVATDTGAYAQARMAIEESLNLARGRRPAAHHRSAIAPGQYRHAHGTYAGRARLSKSLALFTAVGDRHGMALALNGLGNGAIDERIARNG
jgi:hypothetical protein